jgi:uncharacterized protein YndB with AHSA1/START domain
MASAVLTTPTDTQILMVREFDAPPELVWRAYTEPELVSRWWPGRRGTMQSCEIDFRVGGSWRYVMVASEGFEVAFHGEYQEIADGERIVNTEVFEGAPGPGIVVLTVFREVGGRTLLEMLSECGSQEVRDIILDSGMETGAQEGLDILERVAQELDETPAPA